MIEENITRKLCEVHPQENVLWLEIPKEFQHMNPKEYYMMRFRNTLRRSNQKKSHQ